MPTRWRKWWRRDSALPIPTRVATCQSRFPAGTTFVVYCAGPHCNGAHRGAIRLARRGLPVKLMIGGRSGWREQGFSIESGVPAATAVG